MYRKSIGPQVRRGLGFAAAAGVRYLNRLKPVKSVLKFSKDSAVSRGVRKYAPAKTLTTTRKRGPGKAKNTQAPQLNWNHGRAAKLSKKFVKNVRQAAAAIDVQQLRGTSQMSAAIGNCEYHIPAMLYDPTDISVINGHCGSYVDGKFLIRNAVHTLQMTNQRNSCANLRIYECEARSDVPYNATGAYQVYDYLYQGWVGAGLAGNATDIGANAFSSPLFTTWFKVNDVKVVLLNPGECKRFTLEDKSSTLINMQRWKPFGLQRTLCHQKKTKFLIYQVWGQTVEDSVQTTQISTDVVKLDCVWSTKYEYQYIVDTNPTIFTSGSLGTISNFPEFINENTSQPMTGASA